MEEVASRSELAGLLDRMATPAPQPPPTPTPLAEVQAELLARVNRFELGQSGTGLRIRYQSGEALGSLASEMLQQTLRARLKAPELVVALERVVPPRPSASARRARRTR